MHAICLMVIPYFFQISGISNIISIACIDRLRTCWLQLADNTDSGCPPQMCAETCAACGNLSGGVWEFMGRLWECQRVQLAWRVLPVAC